MDEELIRSTSRSIGRNVTEPETNSREGESVSSGGDTESLVSETASRADRPFLVPIKGSKLLDPEEREEDSVTRPERTTDLERWWCRHCGTGTSLIRRNDDSMEPVTVEYTLIVCPNRTTI